MATWEPAPLEEAIGYVFRGREHLKRALTHSSLAYEEQTSGRLASRDPSYEDNEQLEFLGDAVLGLIVAQYLFETYPELHEGDLTRMRAQLVSRKHLGQVGLQLALGAYLRLGRGEERSGGRLKSVLLANAIEALIAAVYLDGGLQAAKEVVVRKILTPFAAELRSQLDAGLAMGDHKSALQEWVQAHQAAAPRYTVQDEVGPDHRKRFTVIVEVVRGDGIAITGQGSGTTKKKAEQEAARAAYEVLRSAPDSQQEPEADKTGERRVKAS